jgi:hypothetical protein
MTQAIRQSKGTARQQASALWETDSDRLATISEASQPARSPSLLPPPNRGKGGGKSKGKPEDDEDEDPGMFRPGYQSCS